MGGMNEFNFRQYGGFEDTIGSFLESKKTSLGIPTEIKYIFGNDQIYESFQDDISRSYVESLVWLLNKETLKVLVYNGQEDYVINTPGVLNYLNKMPWQNI